MTAVLVFLLALLLIGGLFFAWVGIPLLFGTSKKSEWVAIAQRYDLELHAFLGNFELKGALPEGEIYIGTFGGRITRYRMKLDLPDSLMITPGASTALVTGDPKLDAQLAAHGPEPVALAAMNHDARRHLIELNEPIRSLGTTLSSQAGFRVERGWLHIESRAYHGDQAAMLRGIRAATEIARSLTLREEDVPTRLLENARGDPSAGVRRQNLRALMNLRSLSDGLRADALEAGADDASAEVRLEAAHWLGRRGADIARDVLSDGAPDAQRLALDLFVRRATDDQLRAAATELVGRVPDEMLGVIRARLGVESGGLALTEGGASEGGLSEAEAEGGLSEAESAGARTVET